MVPKGYWQLLAVAWLALAGGAARAEAGPQGSAGGLRGSVAPMGGILGDVLSGPGRSLTGGARALVAGIPQPDGAGPQAGGQPAPLVAGFTPAALSGEAAEAVMASVQRQMAGSLFNGRAQGSFFAPVAPRLSPGRGPEGPTAALRDLIAGAEAGPAGYDAVHHGAGRKPPRAPSRMTLDEIRAWIRATPGQNHAIGRYQMIPGTLDHVAERLGIGGQEVYDARVQDRMADFLLEQAGYSGFLGGALSRVGFMNNLAKVWAGLPNSTGKSHYHGIAGNRAVLSWTAFDAAMTEIFES